MRRVSFLLLLLTPLAPRVLAHELRPAYLDLRQSSLDTYDVLWKVPARGEDLRLALYARFPEDCQHTTSRKTFADGASVERWRVHCSGGLTGGTIHIEGLSATLTDVLVRVERLDGTTHVSRLTPAHPSFLVEVSPSHWQVVWTYLVLGVEHILTGIDHLLFVLALLIITRGGRKLVKTVTAFTIAHSITLTAATLGFVNVPQRPVEAVIALSIVFVAAEIPHGRQGHAGITARTPWVVALTFGLLHGLGFAGGLHEVGLPQGHIPLALLFFSLGVETGHFLFICVVLSLSLLARRMKPPTPPWAHLVPPYAIGSIAMFWVIQRVMAF